MSFIVRGINLPEEGQQLRIIVTHNGQIIIDKRTYTEEAEAVQIPKDHGRIGDLDALAQKCSPPDWCVWLSEIEDAPALLEEEE